VSSGLRLPSHAILSTSRVHCGFPMPRGSVISIIRASDVDAELTGSGGDRSSAVFIVGEKLGWRAMLGCPKESIMLRQEGVVRSDPRLCAAGCRRL
jgi:hypothetical protein